MSYLPDSYKVRSGPGVSERKNRRIESDKVGLINVLLTENLSQRQNIDANMGCFEISSVQLQVVLC